MSNRCPAVAKLGVQQPNFMMQRFEAWNREILSIKIEEYISYRIQSGHILGYSTHTGRYNCYPLIHCSHSNCQSIFFNSLESCFK